jgi:hypothetical protein
MHYIIGEQFHGDVGKLSCQLLGSIVAANKKQARRLAELRWPKRELCIYMLDHQLKLNQAALA